MILFVLATCLPAALIACAALFGGAFPLLAVLSLTLMVWGLDHFIAKVSTPLTEQSTRSADILSALLAVIHLALLPLVIWAMAGDVLSTLDKILLFFASGTFFGQVSNSNAHELIHRRTRGLFRLGMSVYISLLHGQHVSSHLLVHHQYVGTRNDPSTARLGESYYRFVYRAWLGEIRGGYRAEAARLRRVQRSPLKNPYLIYGIGSVGVLVISYMIGGFAGVLYHIALASFAQQQLMLCDYVQHYGLERKITETGKLEPVNDTHSWNAPQWYSSGMMLNAPRHSDHHAHPSRPYAMLDLPADGPMLPRSLPVMATLALFPRPWRRVMDRRARDWKETATP